MILGTAGFAAAPAAASAVEEEKIYYGIEINGVLCGYAEFDIAPIEKDGRELILLKEKMFAMLTALGMAFNTEV
ncbi:MAG TPA: hypothetical protein VMX58_03655, partial [Patescibacteria group bacterium]|nr:hypothetical protein [Patescibacteria group bacterium]